MIFPTSDLRAQAPTAWWRARRGDGANWSRRPAFAVFPLRIFQNQPGDSDLLWNRFTEENDLDRFLHSDDAPGERRSPSGAGTAWPGPVLWDERAMSWQDWEFHIRRSPWVCVT